MVIISISWLPSCMYERRFLLNINRRQCCVKWKFRFRTNEHTPQTMSIQQFQSSNWQKSTHRKMNDARKTEIDETKVQTRSWPFSLRVHLVFFPFIFFFIILRLSFWWVVLSFYCTSLTFSFDSRHLMPDVIHEKWNEWNEIEERKRYANQPPATHLNSIC